MNNFLNKIKDKFKQEHFNKIVLYVNENNFGCWLWSNSLDKDGYGRISIDKKHMKAHRLFWELENGVIPMGLVIDHLCKVRNCVNPIHLRLATPRQNVLENSVSLVAINAQKKFCKNGHFYDKTYISPKGEKERYCSICHKDRVLNYRKKKKNI